MKKSSETAARGSAAPKARKTGVGGAATVGAKTTSGAKAPTGAKKTTGTGTTTACAKKTAGTGATTTGAKKATGTGTKTATATKRPGKGKATGVGAQKTAGASAAKVGVKKSPAVGKATTGVKAKPVSKAGPSKAGGKARSQGPKAKVSTEVAENGEGGGVAAPAEEEAQKKEEPPPSYTRKDGDGRCYFWTNAEVCEWLKAVGLEDLLIPVQNAKADGRLLHRLMETKDRFEAWELAEERFGLNERKAQDRLIEAANELSPPTGRELIDAGAFKDTPGAVILLTEVDVAIAECYEKTKRMPLVWDPTGTVPRFLHYKTGFGISLKALFMTKFNGGDWKDPLRKKTLGALRNRPGRANLLHLDLENSAVDVTQFYDDTVFPEKVWKREEMVKRETWVPLFRDDDPDVDDVEDYDASDEFTVVVTSSAQDLDTIPAHVRARCTLIRVVLDNAAAEPKPEACSTCNGAASGSSAKLHDSVWAPFLA